MLLQYARAKSGKSGVMRPGFGCLSIVACSFVVSVCTTILIARLLTPAAFGIYMFSLWLATASVPAIGVGMLTVTSRHIAEIQSQQEPRLAAGIFHFVWRRQYRSILLYCLLYLLLAWPFSKLFGASSPLLFLLLAGLSALPQLLSGVASITLRSLHRFDLLAAIHLFGTVTALLLVILVILALQVQEELIGILLLISAIATTVPLAMALICILRLLPVREAIAPGAMLKDRLTRGLNNSLLLFTMDIIVWQRSELLLLTQRHSTADLGFYALSSIISTRIIDIAPTLLSTCLLPLLLRYVPGQRYTCASDAFVKTSRYVALLTIPLCVGAIIFCPGIISFCFGNVYLPVVMPLRILLVASAFGSIATVSLTHLANGERKQAQIKLGIYAASLNILLAVPCIALWGVTGAAFACAVAQIVSATGSIFICKGLIFG
ncbi:MAG: oligosaccharide flippase family protein [Ktedonobacteraceae bacterium]